MLKTLSPQICFLLSMLIATSAADASALHPKSRAPSSGFSSKIARPQKASSKDHPTRTRAVVEPIVEAAALIASGFILTHTSQLTYRIKNRENEIDSAIQLSNLSLGFVAATVVANMALNIPLGYSIALSSLAVSARKPAFSALMAKKDEYQLAKQIQKPYPKEPRINSSLTLEFLNRMLQNTSFEIQNFYEFSESVQASSLIAYLTEAVEEHSEYPPSNSLSKRSGSGITSSSNSYQVHLQDSNGNTFFEGDFESLHDACEAYITEILVYLGREDLVIWDL